MQLVFLWMDSGKGLIRDLSLQFSPLHPCMYDASSMVLRREQAGTELNIFSEYAPPVTNVSVLVGENGSGKTSIMREIYELLRHRSKTCQFLALYYGKGSKDNLNHEGYYWWSNIQKVNNDNNCPFTIEGFGNDIFVELSDEDVEDDFFIVRYTDVLSLSEYAKRDSLPTRNSCDLTMSYRLLGELEQQGGFVDRQNQDVVMQLYHTETERQIIALNQNVPVSLKSLEIIPCSEMNMEELEALSLRKGNRWEGFGASNSYDIKKKACDLCEEVVATINSWEDLSAVDVFIRSVVYTYLRHVIGRYGIYSDEEMGTGIPAAIKREINVPLIFLRDKLALRSQYQSCTCMENLFRETFESVGVPFNPNQFISNLMCFAKWLLDSGNVRYDHNDGRFYVDIEKASRDKLLEAFRCYKNSIGQYGEVVTFEFNMSSGERAFFNLFAYMNHARNQMDHFFSKSKYPYFALSIYNLIPCCKFCNSSLKLSKDFHNPKTATPYEISYNDCFKFFCEKKNGKWMIRVKEDEKYGVCVSEMLKIFLIKERYQHHTDIVNDYLNKQKEYSGRLLENIKKVYPSEYICYFLSDYFGYPLKVEDIDKNVLNKFKRDLAENLLDHQLM